MLVTLRTPYKFNSHQADDFVIGAFERLFEASAPDFAPLHRELRDLPTLQAG